MGGDSVSGLDSESHSSGGNSMLERSGVVMKIEGGDICWKCYCGANGGGEGALLSLPPGYRFTPSDEELVGFYLKNKVLGEPLPWYNVRIYDVDFYRFNPEYLTNKFQPWGDDTWFFFTHRDRKYKNGKRPNRAAAGFGYWKATGADQQIVISWDVEGEKPLAARKSLVFYEGKPMHGDKTHWIMQEFRIDGLEQNTRTRTEDNMRLDDWVLCKVYKKKKRRSDSEDEEDGTRVKQAGRKRIVSHIQAKRPSRKTARTAAAQVSKVVADYTWAKTPALISLPCVRQFLNLDPISTSLDYGLYNNNNNPEMHQEYGSFSGLDNFPPQPLMMADNEGYCTLAGFMGSAISQQDVNPLNPSLHSANVAADYGGQLSQARSNQGIIAYTHPELKGFGVSNPQEDPLGENGVSNPQEDPLGENDEDVDFDYLS